MFLDVPAHTLNVYGGPDIGVFAQEVRMPQSLTWVNQDSLSTVKESQGVTVSWSGAVPNGYVNITGSSLSVDAGGTFGAGASFFCTANAGPAGAGEFSVPPAVLSKLPLTTTPNSATPSGLLGISTSQRPSDPFGSVRGIDTAIVYTSLQLQRNVSYEQ
jgi:hypothetical protein